MSSGELLADLGRVLSCTTSRGTGVEATRRIGHLEPWQDSPTTAARARGQLPEGGARRRDGTAGTDLQAHHVVEQRRRPGSTHMPTVIYCIAVIIAFDDSTMTPRRVAHKVSICLRSWPAVLHPHWFDLARVSSSRRRSSRSIRQQHPRDRRSHGPARPADHGSGVGRDPGVSRRQERQPAVATHAARALRDLVVADVPDGRRRPEAPGPVGHFTIYSKEKYRVRHRSLHQRGEAHPRREWTCSSDRYRHMAGVHYNIADIACFPWTNSAPTFTTRHAGPPGRPVCWRADLNARPAVQRGCAAEARDRAGRRWR